jgi:hypothetical protein
MNDFIFFFNFMGKAVCFANGMLPGKDASWKPGHNQKTKK